jgi:pimeloyl-ACP methyl ester carboxylesterase
MSQTPLEHLGLTEQRIALVTGVELCYVELGDPHGEVLIFLHGFTDSWRSWELTLPHLSLAYHTFALSQRGHGNSSKPACCYQVADYVGDVLAFLQALHIPRATLIGHSLGSYIAYQVARDHPERVARLVLIGWGPIHPTSPAARARVVKLYTYVQALEDTIDPAFVRAWITSNTVTPLPETYLETQVTESLKVPLVTWQQLLASRLAAAPVPARGPIQAKTLVLYGDQDVYVHEGRQILAQAIAHAQVVIYAAAGHALHWDSPRRFIADLHAFLK